MILPQRIVSIGPDKIFVSDKRFSEARKRFDQERYRDSISILDDILLSPVFRTAGSISLFNVFELYGWNLIFERNFTGLTRWQQSLEQLGIEFDQPGEFNLISLWNDCLAGNPTQVINICSDFRSRSDDTASVITAKYIFIEGYANHLIGDIDRAADQCEMAHFFFKFFREEMETARTANFLGRLHLRTASFIEAQKWLLKALNIYSHHQLARKSAMACINLGVVGYKRANYNRASEYLSRSLHIGREEDDLDIQTHSNIALGNVHRLQRDYETARKHLHTAYNQAQELGFPREEALALEFLGDVYRDEQRPGEARRFYQRAMAIGKRIAPKGDIVMEVHRRLGECHNLEHEPGKARRELLAGLKLAQAQGDRYEEAVILRILGEAQILLADLAGAADYIQQATDLLDQIGARHELAIALMRLAEIRLAQVDSPQDEHESNDVSLKPQSLLTEAWQHANQALEQFIPVGVAWWTERCRVLAERIANRRAEMAARSARSNAKTSRNEHIIIHASLRMRDLLQMCDSLAVSNEPVLIRGETGTGKELIARRLHAHSSRSGRDLVTVNVAAIPASMFEREFFGHVRGAFSGADRDKAGFAAAADGGTLFLDEIGELPMELQPKLLRLLQNGTYQALGDPRERHTDIRLVAATNADLEQAVRAGTFRSDLYFRLKVLQLGVPPLRDRTEDIIPLLRHFLSEAAGQQVEIGTYFAEKALAVMASYDWPGNVRELAMVARQAHLQRSTLGRIEIELERTGRTNLVIHGSEQRELACNAPSPSFNEATERAAILRALAETNGVRTDAARRLGMARSTLYRAMERLGIAGKTKPPHRS